MHAWLEVLSDVSSRLIESGGDYKETLKIIAEQSARLSGACRACVVIENQQGKFVIKAGYPVEGHGINTVLTPTIGEEFLRSVITQGEIVVVENPKEDARTVYMEALARDYNLTKIIFLPLMYYGESLGALVLDFQDDRGKNSALRMKKIELLAKLASSAIGSEYVRRRSEEKILRMERMNAIGEQVLGISHTLRNGLDMKILAWARRMKKKLEGGGDDPECLSIREVMEMGTSVIVAEGTILQRFVNDLLSFATPEQYQPEPTLINVFLREKMGRIFEVKTEFDLDEALEDLPIAIDQKLMSSVIDDLVKNAMQAELPERELIITVQTRYSRRRGCVFVKYMNNGEKMEKGFMGDIFSPFFTTKADGTGLGLPHAKAALGRHGGDIKLIESTDEQTVFEISLPL